MFLEVVQKRLGEEVIGRVDRLALLGLQLIGILNLEGMVRSG